MLNRTVCAVALIALINFTPVDVNAAVSAGPYLQNATKTSMTIHWRSSARGVGRVYYGSNQNNLNLIANESVSTRKHIVTINGLQANTKYFYAVANGSIQETPRNAAQQYFITNPEGAIPTRIWVLGDAGTGTSKQTDVRDAYYTHTGATRTNVVLALGDNAYGSGRDSDYLRKFFKVYKDMFVNTPVWSTQGNHERKFAVYADVFSHPTKGEAGGVASGSELYYSFNYGDIHFICLDSYSSAININPGAPQYQWLERDLQANTKPWVVAFWHHPPYSKTSGHNSDTERGMKRLRENANTLLEQYGIDIVFGGHNHSYSRSYFINGHYGVESTFDINRHIVQHGDGSATPYTKADNKGAVYVMSGSAGKVGYSIDTHDANVAKFYNLGSFVVDIDGDTLTGKYLRENGTVDDRFSITKKSSTNTAPVANAGTDKILVLPNAVNLVGSCTDDGLPAGASVSALWTGNGVQFVNANAVNTTASFLAAGNYTVTLTCNDSLLSTSDSALITVSQPANNVPPIAQAGADTAVRLPGLLTLNGNVIDDGFIGTTLTHIWSKVSGSGIVTFANANALKSTVSFSGGGKYVLRLSASDGEFSSVDDVSVVLLSAPKNQAPVVSAGRDWRAKVNRYFNLRGKASDDGLPKNSTLSSQWRKVSGPGNVVFKDAASLRLGVKFDATGTYVLELTASDGELVVGDQVRVVVKSGWWWWW